MTVADVRGTVSEGFAPVADAFEANFARGAETGAAVSVYLHGEPVVQLCAGTTDDGSSFTAATRSVVFSVSKGITTIAVLMAVERGLLSLDAPVADHWPEFAAGGGKSTITLRHALAHQAGLVAPDEPMTMQQLQEWLPVADVLAAQKPLWEPGTAHAYHAMTFGWLVGEVLRRATGQHPSEWLRHHIAGPLGIQPTFGIDPSSADFSRQALPPSSIMPDHSAAGVDFEAEAMQARIMGMHGAFDGLHLFESANQSDFLATEIPAANLVATADELARIYAATVGRLNGVELLQPETVQDALRVQSSGPPFVGADWGLRWGTGFMIDSPKRRMAGSGSFGHDGAGGQLAFAHAGAGLSFAYVTNQPGGEIDRRAESLCEALRTCL